MKNTSQQRAQALNNMEKRGQHEQYRITFDKKESHGIAWDVME